MSNKKKIRYRFENVQCINVVDGDTIDVLINLGFKLSIELRLRLFRINAPEVRGPEKIVGNVSKFWLKYLIEGKPIVIETFKKGKFGRFLAEIYFEGKNLNDEMVELGLAEYKEY